MTDYISVYFTAASRSEAETIAQALVEEKLVACVNILPGVRSIYRWNNAVGMSDEVALIAKSRRDLFPQIEAKIKSLSSYDCPCIIAWPIAEGHAPYLAWIGRGTL